MEDFESYCNNQEMGQSCVQFSSSFENLPCFLNFEKWALKMKRRHWVFHQQLMRSEPKCGWRFHFRKFHRLEIPCLQHHSLSLISLYCQRLSVFGALTSSFDAPSGTISAIAFCRIQAFPKAKFLVYLACFFLGASFTLKSESQIFLNPRNLKKTLKLSPIQSLFYTAPVKIWQMMSKILIIRLDAPKRSLQDAHSGKKFSKNGTLKLAIN